jgi:hypothetical protein
MAPLGGRSALLGGTGVALGVDGAAPFLNPAAIVRIADRRISFSARFFRLSQRTLTDLHQPGVVDPAYGPLELPETSFRSTRLHSVPDTTCYFFSRSGGEGAELSGRSKLALCLGKTEEQEFQITALNYTGSSAGRRVDQSQSLRDSWGTWSFGPTFAIYLRNDLAVGASLNLTRTRYETSSSISTIAEELGTDAAVSSAYQSAESGSAWGGVAHLGVTYRLSQKVVLGASLRTPSLHVTGDYSASEDSRLDTGVTLSHWGGDGDFAVHTPVRVGLGLGAEYDRVRFEGNVFFHSGVQNFARAEIVRDALSISDAQGFDRSSDVFVRRESVNPVVNFGVGAEYFMSKDLSLLTGFASDVSALADLPERSLDGRLFHERFNAWHAGVGITSYTDYGDLVFGARGDYLTGDMAVLNGLALPLERDRISAREWAITLILAGRVSLSTVAEAAEDLGEIVQGDAKAPAATPPKPLQPPKRD